LARLHEHQGKELLKRHNIPVPKGRIATDAGQVASITAELGCPVVLKAQVWTTKRADFGGIRFAETPELAAKEAESLFGLTVKNFQVGTVLVEEKLRIQSEYYCGVIIDDSKKQPVVIFSSKGGTGIEEIAKDYPDRVGYQSVDMIEGFRNHHARNLVRKTGLSGKIQSQIAALLVKLFKVAQQYEARSAEINPLVLDEDGNFVAADCRMTVDDYAAFRHPELGIEIAREFDQPPSALDKIAYEVEKNDYRGTFYFVQLEKNLEKGEGYVGFHGAGGGGSMMSMDAVIKRGFKVANYTDTSGNPPASKVYRAARIILAQNNIQAYFGSGSGVASQEQFHSARGLVKAFREENLSIPAVIRLGGNQEDLAVEILEKYTKDLPAPVEGYKKDDSADHCADRLKALVDEFEYPGAPSRKPPRRSPEDPYQFETLTGEITYDHSLCMKCETKACISACGPQILKLEEEKPVLAITREEAKKGKCTECLACEIECEFHGNKGAYVFLPIHGLSDITATA
jgi:succinyl-CoA synthetase beta subunit